MWVIVLSSMAWAQDCPEGSKWVEVRGTEVRADVGLPQERRRWCAQPGGTRHGPFQRTSAAGVVLEEGAWKQGRKSGLWTVRDPDGRVLSSVRFERWEVPEVGVENPLQPEIRWRSAPLGAPAGNPLLVDDLVVAVAGKQPHAMAFSWDTGQPQWSVPVRGVPTSGVTGNAGDALAMAHGEVIVVLPGGDLRRVATGMRRLTLQALNGTWVEALHGEKSVRISFETGEVRPGTPLPAAENEGEPLAYSLSADGVLTARDVGLDRALKSPLEREGQQVVQLVMPEGRQHLALDRYRVEAPWLTGCTRTHVLLDTSGVAGRLAIADLNRQWSHDEDDWTFGPAWEPTLVASEAELSFLYLWTPRIVSAWPRRASDQHQAWLDAVVACRTEGGSIEATVLVDEDIVQRRFEGLIDFFPEPHTVDGEPACVVGLEMGGASLGVYTGPGGEGWMDLHLTIAGLDEVDGLPIQGADSVMIETLRVGQSKRSVAELYDGVRVEQNEDLLWAEGADGPQVVLSVPGLRLMNEEAEGRAVVQWSQTWNLDATLADTGKVLLWEQTTCEPDPVVSLSPSP
jgi:hypothetical protein